MSGENDGLEKSFEPSQSKIDRARRDGDVAYSRDATEAAVYLGAFVAVAALAGDAAMRLAQGLAPLLERPDALRGAADFEAVLQAVLLAGAAAAAPFLIAPMLLAGASVGAQRALVFAPKKLAPKWERLSPFDNAKKKFGGEGLVEATKVAILNANYIKESLKDHYATLYSGANGRCAHEMILDCREWKKDGVEVADIAKRLMDFGFHAPAVSAEEGLAAIVGHGAAGSDLEEVALGQLAAVEGGDGDGIGDQRTKGLHEIQRQRGPAGTGHMQRAECGFETRQAAGRDAVVREHGISKGEHAIDRVRRRPALAAVRVEAIGDFLDADLEHAGKVCEVDGSGVAFMATKLFNRCGL